MLNQNVINMVVPHHLLKKVESKLILLNVNPIEMKLNLGSCDFLWL